MTGPAIITDKPIRILIVDDHKMLRDGLKLMIASFRKNLPSLVEEAETSKEALLKLERKPFDLVIIDYRLPDRNGADTVLAMLRAHPRLAILGLSNYDEIAQVQNMLEAGASGYLLKNIEARELQSAIRNTLLHKPSFSNEIAIKLLQKDELPTNPLSYKPLTPREKEILQYIVQEWSDDEISRCLNISKRTIQTHRSNLLHKLNVRNLAGLVKMAIRLKLVNGE